MAFGVSPPDHRAENSQNENCWAKMAKIAKIGESTADQFLEWYDGATREQLNAALEIKY